MRTLRFEIAERPQTLLLAWLALIASTRWKILIQGFPKPLQHSCIGCTNLRRRVQ